MRIYSGIITIARLVDQRPVRTKKVVDEMDDETVATRGGKLWKTLLIPHDKIDESKPRTGLAARWEMPLQTT